ncbi:MAG: sigma-54-dependent Fis family transcriptional regulator [Candidatus Koribacter versatilis]|uniref:Sigma-54-dependent Fis family transcriptional regulator n=1 Tax=Candidatus Korobacter versatilis TaxID=658062 RepID=A0A932EPU3_9BACT|nr:sigma-54-dependent Fis family transcriptional regulator [Candidatus Koribacter versatilis]
MSHAAVLTRRPASENAAGLGSILIIDDEAAIRESLETLLDLEGYAIESAENGEEGLARLAARPFDLVLLDFALPDMNGLEVLAEIRDRDPQLAVIMITAYGTVENAVRAVQAGATNFIQKPWDNEKLLADVRAAVARRRAEDENVQLKRALKQRYNFEHIVGKSDPMLKIFDLVAQVAPSRSTVLIQGESGTGKELIAKAIHANSPRKDRAFVPVNTGSMPADLLESTLFGHVKGAFTSAIASKKGLFEVANGGTLFLDEIGTMSLDTQAKILRVLQDKKFMHLGGVQEVQVDVRIIAATNVDLKKQVDEGRFREDLFYRLNVIAIELPPLRARREDIAPLVHHFLEKFSLENGKMVSGIAPEGLRPLLDYAWPGNVRELENVIERAVVLAPRETVTSDLLPSSVLGRDLVGRILTDRADATLFEIIEECERRVITDMLEKCAWNQTEAAERFHIPLSTLNQKIKRLNIEIRKKAKEA